MPGDEPRQARPAAPLDEAALLRSIRVIRIAIAIGVVSIIAFTWAFIELADAPAMPLVPLAALVIVVDIAFLVMFTRQRNQALAEIRRKQGRVV